MRKPLEIPSRFLKKGVPVALLLALALSAAACAPKAADGDGKTSGKEDAGAAVAVEWSPESDCAMCHTAEASSREDASCLAATHTASKCIDCHAESDALAAEHEGATADGRLPKRLTKTEVSQDTCLSCHDSYEALAEKTAAYQGLVDSEGTVVNPHALPASDNHADVTCTNCHAVHVAGANPEEKSKSTCTSCHHADVFACGTCHN